jgi:hypothetical protein
VIYFSVLNKKNPSKNGEGRIRVVQNNNTGEDYLTFTLSGVDMDFELEYSMHSQPEWVHDKGKGRITIRGMTISMRVVPEVRNGTLYVKVVEDLQEEVTMHDYNVEFEGVTDFSKAIDYILNNFKEFFKVEVATILTSSSSQAFSEVLARMLQPYQGSFI